MCVAAICGVDATWNMDFILKSLLWLDHVQLESVENIETVSTEEQRDALREELSEVDTAFKNNICVIAIMMLLLLFSNVSLATN